MAEDRDVVVVTGASAGVGRATARAFAEEGAQVGLLARGEAGLEGARRDVEAAGGEAVTVQTDVADADQVEAAADEVEAAFGPIDVWVNAAMASVLSEVSEMRAEEYQRVTDVTYMGYVHGTLTALDRMRPRDEGQIIQVGSALAYRGIPLQSAYSASKHAVKGFTESLRTELLHEGSDVTVSIVQLPGLNTPQFEWVRNRLPKGMQPVPPFYQPEVAADAVMHAAETGRTELWVGWPTFKTILGNRISSRLVDYYLARTGYDGQQTDEIPADHPDNLWEPVDDDRDYGARGPFDDRAHQSSPLLWATKHRRPIALAVAVVATVVAVLTASAETDDE